VWIDNCDSCSIFQVNGYGCNMVQEKIVILQYLGIHWQSKEMDHTFGKKDSIVVVCGCIRCHPHEEFAEEFGIMQFALDSNHFG